MKTAIMMSSTNMCICKVCGQASNCCTEMCMCCIKVEYG